MPLSSPLAPLRSKPATLRRIRASPPLPSTSLYIEQIEEDIARGKTRREGYRTPELEAEIEAEISRLKKRRAVELKRLLAILRPSASERHFRCFAHADLANRFDLLISVPGIGERTAIALLIRMPELGTLSREKVAALAGLAPFDDDGGKRKGSRLSPAGVIASEKVSTPPPCPQTFQWNPALVALYGRLKTAGDPPSLPLSLARESSSSSPTPC
jgi:transposase